ncbi:hypothetical protein ABIB48_002802 [Arthrobacter sp. UYCu511]
MAQLKRLMKDWNTSEDSPSASATSPTTSPDRCWNHADSDRKYTLNSDVLVYLIARGNNMTKRSQQAAASAQQQGEEYLRRVAGIQSPAD